MQQILVYSDSLSWGIVPSTRRRLPFDARWPGVMESALNRHTLAVRVIEDCLNGRRTVWEDPFKPGRMGLSGLEQRIEMHSPLALVVLMLGTNDFQSVHNYDAWQSGQGIATLVAAIRRAPIEPGMPVPPVLIVAPPPIQTPQGPLAHKFAGAAAKSAGLAAAYRAVAAELNLSVLRCGRGDDDEQDRWDTPGHGPAREFRPGARGRRCTAARRAPAMSRSALSAMTRIALPVLRRLDPEVAHDLGLAGLALLRPFASRRDFPQRLALRCAGLRFAHPLGLAAGFDKNGDYIDALGAIGFSHIEVGTVTPRAQIGSPKPRMFRIPAAQALVNRMGFNNKGADHLARRLAGSRYRGIRGISIGKNFDTPIDRAQDDYVACLRKLYQYADYFAVNVSSPNTAQLRELQGRDGLQRVVGALLEERAALAPRFGKQVPLFVKIAPDLDPEQFSTLGAQLRILQVDGVIATNTSNDLSDVASALPPGLAGGLSGQPLRQRSLATIRRLRAELGAKLPIIGVGGIFGAEDALAALEAGANLIQVYTGFAYRGAELVDDILDALARRPVAAPAPNAESAA